jgi:hypothetical protein
VYFSSNRGGGTYPWDIYVSMMVGEDRETFGPPIPVYELNSSDDDCNPFVRRKDGLEIIFFSTRPGGQGNQDLWSSTRPNTSSPWSPPVLLTAAFFAARDDFSLKLLSCLGCG